MQNSIWADQTTLPSFPSLSGDLKTDVLIVGGGLAGILCAYRLAQAGVDYALIEADRIASGVTRNTTAKITSQHGLIYADLIRKFNKDVARDYWRANEAALKAYRALASTIPCDFETKSNFIYSTRSRSKLDLEMEALDRLRIPAELAEQLPLPFATVGAVRFRNQAQFDPLKFLSGLVPGLRIFENTKALEFVGNTVKTKYGTITASKIVIATHFPILNKHGLYFLKLYQRRSYVLALENAANVKGMYLDEAQDGLSFRNHGDLLLLGGGGHRTGKQGGGWRELDAIAQKHYLGARAVARWAAQDCMSLDGIPYIGPYSESTPELFVATGFNKWGMTSSMAAAMILSDLVQGKDNPYAHVFAPSRTMLRPQLLVNTMESAVNLLTPTRPRCPHMGCALKWNPTEHSWDCPCHGSRFTKDGKLLDNPATDDMKTGRS